jgi:hypothetical protein
VSTLVVASPRYAGRPDGRARDELPVTRHVTGSLPDETKVWSIDFDWK